MNELLRGVFFNNYTDILVMFRILNGHLISILLLQVLITQPLFGGDKLKIKQKRYNVIFLKFREISESFRWTYSLCIRGCNRSFYETMYNLKS